MYSQFPEHIPDPNQVPKKVKARCGANPYKQLNQLLDFQIKQAKLEKLNQARPSPDRNRNSSPLPPEQFYKEYTAFNHKQKAPPRVVTPCTPYSQQMKSPPG